MDSIESVKSGPDGKFTINQAVEGPHLIQTAWDGVTYNHMLPPGSSTAGLGLEVYDASNSLPPGAKVSTHMVLLEPGADRMNVSESIVFENTGKITYNDPEAGTYRFYVGSAEGRITVRATAPQGMPIERAAEKTGTANVYKVDFPVKPGETRIDVNYTMPFASPGTYTGKVLHGGAAVRIVAPNGVKLSGGGTTMLGQEPSTMASIYEVKGSEYSLQVEGTGSLSQQTGAAGEEEDTGAGLRQIRPRVYDRFYLVLGLSLVILTLGFLLLLRRKPAPATQPAEATAGKTQSTKGSAKGNPRG
jgi:hypothetical protein